MIAWQELPASLVLVLILALHLGLSSCATSLPGQRSDNDASRRIGNLVVSGVPEIPAALTQRIGQYRNTRTARLLDWLDDGVLLTTRFGDSAQLHRVRSPGGAREQLTFFAEPVSVAFVPPHGRERGFVYSRDVGGSEFYQLFWFDLSSGQSRLLSDGKSRYTEVVWANGADRFAYTTTERDGVHWDLHVQGLDGKITPLLETEEGAWFALDWHPDDSKLLIMRYVSVVESYLFELTINDGTLAPLLNPLLDHSLQTGVGDARYGPDGRGIYFVADLGAEFLRLHHLDLESGKVDVLTNETPWDVEELLIAPDGQHLAYTINRDGWSQVSVINLPDHTPLALPAMPEGVIYQLRFAPDSLQLGFVVDGPQTPADVFSLDLSSRKVSRWTRSEVGGLNVDGFVAPELVRYPTFDARHIPAFVYRPPGPGPHPVVVAIHGGPASQYRPRFSPSIQYYVNEMGIAVVAPNVRGSAGYGKSYLKLDDRYQREDSVRDIGALLDWIETQPDLDASRVAVSGGSYGGYMVLASLVHYSHRLAAGLERVGISNFATFLANTQAYRQDLRRVEYGDERVPEMRRFLEAIAPLNQVAKIRKPLMVSQGKNDPRVPASESEQIVAALRASQVPVWYVLALDEGHGFYKKRNADYNASASALFLQQFLLR